MYIISIYLQNYILVNRKDHFISPGLVWFGLEGGPGVLKAS